MNLSELLTVQVTIWLYLWPNWRNDRDFPSSSVPLLIQVHGKIKEIVQHWGLKCVYGMLISSLNQSISHFHPLWRLVLLPKLTYQQRIHRKKFIKRQPSTVIEYNEFSMSSGDIIGKFGRTRKSLGRKEFKSTKLYCSSNFPSKILNTYIYTRLNFDIGPKLTHCQY